MQVKNTRYHLTSVKMATVKKTTNNTFLGGCGEKGILVHFWWECKCKLASIMENSMELPKKN